MKFKWIFCFVVFGIAAQAQELRATVKVLSPEVQMTNKTVFTALETGLQEFVNSYRWSTYTYAEEEKIQCSFIFTIKSVDNGVFNGNLQVQYSRPIYNSSYSSPVLNVMDNSINFTYAENQPIDFQEGQYTDNLSAVMAFYSYIIIGLDRATYKIGAGEEFFQKANTLVQSAQSTGGPGWRSFDGQRNRFWLADNLTSVPFEPVLKALYNYHRLGLDKMHDPKEQKAALETIKNAISSLHLVHQSRPNSYLLTLFFLAKSDEIVQVFSEASEQGVNVDGLKVALQDMDNTHSEKYEKLGK